MRSRARSVISIRILLAVTVATSGLAGCHHAAGKIMADTTLLPYKAPDIDDLTGIDSDPAPADDAAPAGAK